MWSSSGRKECGHLQGGKIVAIFRVARILSFSGRKECGNLQGGKNVAIFRAASMWLSSVRQEQEYSHPEDGHMSG